MKHFAVFIGDGSCVFRKKIQMGMQKMKFQVIYYSPQPCLIKLDAAQFHCNFSPFHCLESFCRHFQMPSMLFFSIAFNFVLMSWSSNSCVFWPHSFWQSYALNRQTLCFLYPSLSQIFLSNRAWCAVEANRFLTSHLKQDVPHSFDLVLFLNRVAIFLFCNVIPSLGCPIHIKNCST